MQINTVPRSAQVRLSRTLFGTLIAVLCSSTSLQAAELTWQGRANNGSKGDTWDLSNKSWGGSTLFSNGSASTLGDNVTFGSAGDHSVKIEGALPPNTVTITTGQTYDFTPTVAGSGIHATGALTLQSNSSLTLLPTSLINTSANPLLSTSSPAGITVNNGGSLILGGTGNHIGDTTNLTLSGGGIQITSAGASEIMGALTMTTPSLLNFLGTGSSLTFSSFSASSPTVLNVYNWDTNDHLYFGSAPSSNITFNFYGGTPQAPGTLLTNASYEVVPEPSTVLAGLGLVGMIGWRERRRISALLRRTRGLEALQAA